MKNNQLASILMAYCLIQVAPTLASGSDKPSCWQSFTRFFKPDSSLNHYKETQYCDVMNAPHSVQLTDNKNQQWKGYSDNRLRDPRNLYVGIACIAGPAALGLGATTIACATSPSYSSYADKTRDTSLGALGLVICAGTFKFAFRNILRINYFLNRNKEIQKQLNIPEELGTKLASNIDAQDKNINHYLWQPVDSLMENDLLKI